MKKSITIIDTFGFLFRSYFALPPLRSSSGFPTGLLTGFMNFVAGIGKDFKTDYIVFALDAKGTTFRNELFENYKAYFCSARSLSNLLPKPSTIMLSKHNLQ